MAKSRARQWADILANTPVYADANNNLTVDTTTFHVDGENNRVGIGTSSPDTLLNIQGANPTLLIQDSDEAGDGYIKFQTAAGTQRGYIQTAMTSDVMLFGTGTTERMRIDSSGRVGIGITPTSDFHHYKNASAVVQRIQNQTSGMQFQMNDGVESGAGVIYMEGSGPLTLWTGGSQRMRIDSSGNFLHQTTSNTISGTSINKMTLGDGTGQYGIIQNVGTGSGYYGFANNGTYKARMQYDLANEALTFQTNATERVRIDSSGVVTISNQPSIHLDGNSNARYNTSGVNITQFSVSHSYGGMSFNSSNGRVTVPTSGRYLVCWNFYTYFDNTGELRIQLQVNGTGRMHSHKETQSGQSAYSGLWDDNLSGSTVINLAANDAIGFYVVNVTTGGGYYMGSQHSYWSAHLLG